MCMSAFATTGKPDPRSLPSGEFLHLPARPCPTRENLAHTWSSCIIVENVLTQSPNTAVHKILMCAPPPRAFLFLAQ